MRRCGVSMVTGEGGKARGAEFCVLGMGKLGAEELSYHSDLDIIFLYSGAGETVPPPGPDPAEFRKVSNNEYFAKVAQRLTSILTTVTREGYVYPLDTRLRPSGNAGPLVSSLAAFERYHEQSAQLWERQALLRCRFVAGDRGFGRGGGETGRPVHLRPSPPPRRPGRDQPAPETHGGGAGERASGPAKPQGGARGERLRCVRRAVTPAVAVSGR